jgi:hypothetical protein
MPSVKDRSAIINLAIKYGSILLFVCALVNVYLVMRYRELYTKAGEAEQVAQRYLLQQRAVEGVLRDFSARAANDATIMQILRRAQEASNAARQQQSGASAGSATSTSQ